MTVEIAEILKIAPVIPVLTISRLEHAIPMAKAIRDGGLSVLEVTLRTPVALDAIHLIKGEFFDLTVGAGTVSKISDVEKAVDIGASFLSCPGSTSAVIDASLESGVALLPGVSTVSEVINMLDRGIVHMKLFPAEASGGIAMLDSIYRPFPQAVFCPAGGINQENAMDYLSLANVSCVSGSWIASKHLVDDERWWEIEENAKEASSLKRFQ